MLYHEHDGTPSLLYGWNEMSPPKTSLLLDNGGIKKQKNSLIFFQTKSYISFIKKIIEKKKVK